MKKTNSITPATEALINKGLALQDEAAVDAGALGFMARAMVQASLPHRKVDGPEFTRRNGNFTLTILAPSRIGLPYGSIPRLLLAYVTTKATKTQSREIELGESMAAFMRELGLAPTGGSRGNITRLKDQARRLFRSTVSLTFDDGRVDADVGFRLADETVFWWAEKNADPEGWQSAITLTERFFREIVDRPVPVDMRALKALRQSPLALDIYCWSTYRASYTKKPSTIPWASLAAQFGSDYKLLRQFKAAFLGELAKVAAVYPEARFEEAENGLIVKPGKPHITKRKQT